MSRTAKHTAPRGLRPATRAWWLDTMERWDLENHHTRLLTLAAQAWDESQMAAAIVRREGLIVTMPSGAKRPHPALRVVQESRIAFARLLRELDLDLEAPTDERRPPMLRSIAGARR